MYIHSLESLECLCSRGPWFSNMGFSNDMNKTNKKVLRLEDTGNLIF